MGWQQSQGDGTDDPDPSLGGAHAIPSGSPASGGGTPTRDPRLTGFARDGEWDTCPPSATLAAAVQGASGPEWRCPGASHDEMLGLLRQAQALESRAAATKLGILRALIRDEDQPLPGGGYHDDLPEGWTRSLTHEVTLALSMPAISAERLMWVAWDLHARLPGTGALLADGVLTYAKAKAVYEVLLPLGDEAAARAEAMILPQLPGKTYGQVQKLAEQAAITLDPESAARRREDAEQHRCRVEMLREESGAAALSGRDLPTDQTLAAHASVCARAREYKDSGVFPADTRMDQYRVAAYLDLLNAIPSASRIASGQLVTVTRDASQHETDADDSGPGDGGSDIADNQDPDNGGPGNNPPDNGNPDDNGPGPQGPDDGRDGGSPRSPGGGCGAAELPPRLADLVLPLATLLGLAERPGEGHGLGPLDPSLCRELAVAAVGSPWTRLCVTVTDADGIAIGHGCAKPLRLRGQQAGMSGRAVPPPPGNRAALALPAQANLTIPAALLAELAAAGPPGPALWAVTRTNNPGPPGGFGTWTLTLPDGRHLSIDVEPMPTFGCDHRHESRAYQPNGTLRHLVQVRDYECTFPPCSRHAQECDFEHAVPYDKGGRTCGCNAGARSRTCHQVKQSPGWNVTQPRPGWHQWETPSGRSYTQGPKRYPA
jgi:hypothetical protein